MIIQRQKLYMGRYADVRSYELEALKKDEPLIIQVGTAKMTLTNEQAKKRGLKLNTTPIISKVNPNQVYTLTSYLFTPDKELTEDERLEELVKLIN